MSGSYHRPSIAAAEYRGDDGAVIEYGNRWGMDIRPDEAYIRVSHPERFAGMHAAPALNYGCDACEETLDTAADERQRLVRAVAAGEYNEWMTGRWCPARHMSVTFPGGSSSSAGPLRFSSLP